MRRQLRTKSEDKRINILLFFSFCPYIQTMPPKHVKKAKRKQSGRGITDKLVQLAKDTKIISKAINTFAPDNRIAQGAAGVASQLGYGRSKRKQRGRGLLDSLGSILGGVGHGIGAGGYGLLSGLTGGSRSRVQSYAVNPMLIR